MRWHPALNGPAYGGQSTYGCWLSLTRANLNAGSVQVPDILEQT
jgi:hypothetical protein